MIEFFIDGVGFRVEGAKELKQILDEGIVDDIMAVLELLLSVANGEGYVDGLDDNPFGFTLEGDDEEK